MNAYLVIQATITDPTAFAEYTKAVPPLVAQFGGKYIAMGPAELLEGDYEMKSMVISEWPNKQSALAFWHSDEYRAKIKYREGTGTFNVTLVEGLSPAP
jgi:uncharacterized protein (DUF1330 family)